MWQPSSEASRFPQLASFVETSRQGIGVRLRVSAGARADRIDGFAPDADGRAWLKVAVRRAPERGQANAAVLALLAREWMVPKSALRIVTGATSRHKIVCIEGDPGDVSKHLAAWTARRFAE